MVPNLYICPERRHGKYQSTFPSRSHERIVIATANDVEPIGEIDKDDAVRERVNGHSPHVAIFYPRSQSADLGKALNELERPAGLSNESLGHTSVSISVPGSRPAVLGLCWLDDLETSTAEHLSFDNDRGRFASRCQPIHPREPLPPVSGSRLPTLVRRRLPPSCRLSSNSAAIFARSSSGNSNA